MTDNLAAHPRWFKGLTHDGIWHLFEPYRNNIGDAYRWEALCGLYGVRDDESKQYCATCLESLYERFADDEREVPK